MWAWETDNLRKLTSPRDLNQARNKGRRYYLALHTISKRFAWEGRWNMEERFAPAGSLGGSVVRPSVGVDNGR